MLLPIFNFQNLSYKIKGCQGMLANRNLLPAMDRFHIAPNWSRQLAIEKLKIAFSPYEYQFFMSSESNCSPESILIHNAYDLQLF